MNGVVFNNNLKKAKFVLVALILSIFSKASFATVVGYSCQFIFSSLERNVPIKTFKSLFFQLIAAQLGTKNFREIVDSEGTHIYLSYWGKFLAVTVKDGVASRYYLGKLHPESDYGLNVGSANFKLNNMSSTEIGVFTKKGLSSKVQELGRMESQEFTLDVTYRLQEIHPSQFYFPFKSSGFENNKDIQVIVYNKRSGFMDWNSFVGEKVILVDAKGELLSEFDVPQTLKKNTDLVNLNIPIIKNLLIEENSRYSFMFMGKDSRGNVFVNNPREIKSLSEEGILSSLREINLEIDLKESSADVASVSLIIVDPRMDFNPVTKRETDLLHRIVSENISIAPFVKEIIFIGKEYTSILPVDLK